MQLLSVEEIILLTPIIGDGTPCLSSQLLMEKTSAKSGVAIGVRLMP